LKKPGNTANNTETAQQYETEKIIKKVTPSGNAGGVYVPKKWINRYVVVTLFRAEEYVLDTFRPYINDIHELYLYGSYARGDACPESDINAFVIAERDIPYHEKPGLNAEIVLREKLSEYAETSPIEFYSMTGEAVALKDTGGADAIKGYVLNDEG